MRRFIWIFTVVLTIAFSAQAFAEEAKVTGSASIGAFNKYVFRGYEISNRSVVLQPSASISYQGVGMSVWSNIDSRERATQSFLTTRIDAADVYKNGGSKNMNETDLTLSYTYNISKLALTGGWIYYGTDYVRETEEVFLTAALDVLSKPTLSIYQDIGHYKATYMNLSFAHSQNVTKEITFDVGASAGYMIGEDNYWRTYNTTSSMVDGIMTNYNGSKYKGFHDGMVKAGFTIPAGKFSIQPGVQYWFPLSGNAKKKVTDPTNVSAATMGGSTKSYNPNGHIDPTVVYGLNITLNF